MTDDHPSSPLSALETAVAKKIGVKYAVISPSGRQALQTVLQAVPVGPGDEVITSPFADSCVAAAIVDTGARLVFADINPHTYTLEAANVEHHITKQTKAIVPVHLYGYPANMDALMHLANEHGLYVIEESSQALLARCDGITTGSIGHAGCLELRGDKNKLLGCITTNDDELAAKCRALNPTEQITSQQADCWLALLNITEERTEQRRKAAAWYAEELAGIPVVLPPDPPAEWEPSYSYYVIRTEKRTDLKTYLENHGVKGLACYPTPLYEQTICKPFHFRAEDYPVTQQAAQEILALPLTADITQEEIVRVCNLIREFYEEA